MLVLPQSATSGQLAEILTAAFPLRRTFGFSHDDAGTLGGTVVLYNISRDCRQPYQEFYGAYYPTVTIVWAYTSDWEDNGNDDPPDTDRKTRGHIGLHLQGNASGVPEFIARVEPAVVKCVMGFERALDIKHASPHTAVVVRHYNDNSEPFIHHPYGPAAGARAWIDQFRDSVTSIAGRLRTEHGDQEILLYVEGPNEEYATGADNSAILAFDIAFCQAVAEMEARIGPVPFTAAVGNPGEEEYEALVPLARACADAKGLMGYHNYWLANPGYGGPDHLWQHLAGRWTEMDKVFVRHGVYVRWFGGESGVVGGKSGPGWVSLMPHDGWKSKECLGGDWNRYLDQIMRADELIAQWNSEHGDRYLGVVLFTTSGPGWDSFDIGTNEIAGIGDALLERYT